MNHLLQRTEVTRLDVKGDNILITHKLRGVEIKRQ